MGLNFGDSKKNQLNTKYKHSKVLHFIKVSNLTHHRDLSITTIEQETTVSCL